MAKDSKAASTKDDGKDAKDAKGGRGKLVIILVIVAVAMLGAGGGLAWYLMAPKKGKADAAKSAKKNDPEEERDEASDKNPPVFYTLERFTVKLQRPEVGAADNYLQVSVDLRLADPKLSERLKQHAPIISHEVMLLLSSKNATWLESTENKVKLAEEVRDKVNEIVGIRNPKNGITNAYFTSFILQ